jgi:hypothetical protein
MPNQHNTPDERTQLIERPGRPAPLPGFLGKETNWRTFGFGVTCIAMFPQGLLGMVLWDTQLAEAYFAPPVRIITDTCIIVGSIVGKLMIVYYFNGPKWAEFAHPDWRIFNPRSWTPGGILNTIQTIPISIFFSWLAGAGCTQAADIIESYGSNFSSHVAGMFRYPLFYLTFCVTSFGANLLSFRPIHSGTVAQIRGAVLEIVESPEYQRLKQAFRYDILEKVRMHFKNLYAECERTGNYQPYIEAVHNILTIPEGEALGASSADYIDRTKLIDFARKPGEHKKVAHEGWTEWAFNKFTTGTAAALVTAGVYNFYSLTQKFMTELFCGGHIFGGDAYDSSSTAACPTAESPAGQTVINLCAAMVLASMSGMALCIMRDMTHTISRRMFGRPPVNVLSTLETVANTIWSLGIIGFGAAPNTQQAFMARLSPGLEVLAPLSSMGYEGLGVYDITEELAIYKKSWTKQLAHYVDQSLRHRQESISPEDVRAFERATQVSDLEAQTPQITLTPRYSGWFRSVRSFFGRGNAPPPTVSANIDTDTTPTAPPMP